MASRKKPSESSSPQHLSQLPFAEALAQIATGSGGFSAPSGVSFMAPEISRKPIQTRQSRSDGASIFEIEPTSDEDIAMEVLHETDLSAEKLRRERDKRADDDYDEKFDSLIEGTFESSEDATFRNSLIAMGRKYAVEGARNQSKAASQVAQSFARQETAISGLIEEYVRTTSDVQQDLEMLRGTRSRNFKALADLVSAKASLLSGRLSAIKELDAIAAKKHELEIKIENARKEDGSGNSAEAQRVIQQLFAVGRGNYVAIDSPGDSGATEEEYLETHGDASPGGADYNDGSIETAIHDAIEPETTDHSGDGDKFIEHEYDGMEYVLDIGEDGTERQIYAINNKGEVVPDYPLPSDPGSLSFDINDRMGTATDQLQRQYRVRKAGIDLLDVPKKEEDSYY